MKVSTRGRYALRMMVDLALNGGGGCVSLKDIAQRQGISAKYLEQITGLLMKGGFLKSVRGAQGGYRLSRLPTEYMVGEILRAAEGDLSPVSCLTVEVGECERAGYCEVLKFWHGLDKRISQYVDNVTLAELAAGEFEV